MADIETDGPVIRRFMNRLAVTAVLVAQRTSIGSTLDPDPIRTVRHTGAVAAAHSVATHGSGAPCQFSRSFLDQSNRGRRERSYSPPGRLDNFHKKPKIQDRLVQAQLPMNARPARISRLHE